MARYTYEIAGEYATSLDSARKKAIAYLKEKLTRWDEFSIPVYRWAMDGKTPYKVQMGTVRAYRTFEDLFYWEGIVYKGVYGRTQPRKRLTLAGKIRK